MSTSKWSPLKAMVAARRPSSKKGDTADPLATAPIDILRRHFEKLRQTEGEHSPSLRRLLQSVLYPPPGAEIPHERRQELLQLLGVSDKSPRYLHQLVVRLAPAMFAAEVVRRVALAHVEIDANADAATRFEQREDLVRRTLIAFEHVIPVGSEFCLIGDLAQGVDATVSALSVLGPIIRHGIQRLVQDAEAVDDLKAAGAFRTIWHIYGLEGWFQVLQGNVGLGPDLSHLPVLLARDPSKLEYTLIELEHMKSEHLRLGAYRTFGFGLALKCGASAWHIHHWCPRNVAWPLQVQLIECLDRQGRTAEATERLLSLRAGPKRDGLLAARGLLPS